MSAEYQNQDPIKLATQAEQDLNSHSAKHGHNADLSSNHGHGASDSSKSLSSGIGACGEVAVHCTSKALHASRVLFDWKLTTHDSR